MNRITIIALAALLAITLLAAPARAGIAEDLTAVKNTANALINGGTLEKAAASATQKVVSAVEKAEAVDAQTDPVKYWKKASAVLKKTDAAEKKGVDLGTTPDDLLGSLMETSSDQRIAAVSAQNSLFVDKDKVKVGKTISKGDSKEDKAKLKETNGQKGKLYVSAAKLFLKGTENGAKLLQKEFDKGLVVFELDSTSLDGNPVLMPGESVELVFNIAVDPGAANPDLIMLTDDATGALVTIRFDAPPVPNEAGLLAIPEPAELVPGLSYTLTIMGSDSPSGLALTSRDGIPFTKTTTVTFTVSM